MGRGEERALFDAQASLGDAEVIVREQFSARPVRVAARTYCLLRALGPLLAFCAGIASAQQQPLRIVATTTDLKSLAEAVGGDRVSVTSIVPPQRDAEDYQPKPQDVARLRDAALLLRVGADYDLWVDKLAQQSGRRELLRGGERHVDGSLGIALLDVRGTQVGPSGGHAHGNGNPHYWLDPANAEIITGVIVEALARVDAANAKFYEAERTKFLQRLHGKMREWEKAIAPVQGKPMLAYHNTWAYFARRFRLNFVATIEPRAGVPPPPAHLIELRKIIQNQIVSVIVRQPNEPLQQAQYLAAKSGAKLLVLAASVGAVREASDYLTLFDHNIGALAQAFR
jgi:ABC-type Zn uptake system ZnuABC Zn-binding protein ZnuA